MSSLLPDKFVKMQSIHDSTLIERIGYVEASKRLYIIPRGGGATVCFEGVPRFRHSGFLGAPRKDEYYKAFIQPVYLNKPVDKLPGE